MLHATPGISYPSRGHTLALSIAAFIVAALALFYTSPYVWGHKIHSENSKVATVSTLLITERQRMIRAAHQLRSCTWDLYHKPSFGLSFSSSCFLEKFFGIQAVTDSILHLCVFCAIWQSNSLINLWTTFLPLLCKRITVQVSHNLTVSMILYFIAVL